VGADLGHRAVAPAMAEALADVRGIGLQLLGLDRHIHFFRPEMFAEIRFHNQAMSCDNVRCISARTSATLYPLCACTLAFASTRSAALLTVSASGDLPSRNAFASSDS